MTKIGKVISAMLFTLIGEAQGQCTAPTYRTHAVFETVVQTYNQPTMCGPVTTVATSTTTTTSSTTTTTSTTTTSTTTTSTTTTTTTTTSTTTTTTLASSTSTTTTTTTTTTTLATSTSTTTTTKTTTTTSTTTTSTTTTTTSTTTTTTTTTTTSTTTTSVTTATTNTTTTTINTTNTSTTTTSTTNTSTTTTTTLVSSTSTTTTTTNTTNTSTTTTSTTNTSTSTTTTTTSTTTTSTTTTTITTATTTLATSTSTTSTTTTTTTTLATSTSRATTTTTITATSSTTTLATSTSMTTTITGTTTTQCSYPCSSWTDSLVTGCASIDAGATATCSKVTSNTLANSCLAETFDMKCPTYNSNSSTAPQMVQQNTIKCGVCQLAVGTDLDTRQNKYIFKVSFGQNTLESSIDESMLDGYKLFWVDNNGMILEQAGEVAKRAMGGYDSCCLATKYEISAAGNALPTGASRFMVVPYKGTGYLQVGQVTGTVTDVYSADVALNVVNGDMELRMTKGDAEAFAADEKAKTAMKKTIAAQLTDVDAARVVITGYTMQAVRRLRENTDSRRLNQNAAYKLVVQYEIILPAGTDANAVSTQIGAIPEDAFKTALNTELQAQGVPVTVTSVQAIASPVVTPVQPQGTASGAFSTGVATLVVMFMIGVSQCFFP